MRLGVPLLRAVLAGERGQARRFYRSLPLPVGAGVVVGLVLLLLNVVFMHSAPQSQLPPIPPPWQGFLAAFNAAINEELLLRLGLMTLLVWLGSKCSQPKSWVIWLAIGAPALFFGAAHVLTASYLGPLTTITVACILFGNGIAGLVFGWLYWGHGLEAAMVAHFCTNILLHAIAVAFGL